ncbi:MAG: hypothetical protein U0894_10220 [Pirellulales bacterium]
MKYNIPKERVLSASHDDSGFDVAAGSPAIDVHEIAACEIAAGS